MRPLRRPDTCKPRIQYNIWLYRYPLSEERIENSRPNEYSISESFPFFRANRELEEERKGVSGPVQNGPAIPFDVLRGSAFSEIVTFQKKVRSRGSKNTSRDR